MIGQGVFFLRSLDDRSGVFFLFLRSLDDTTQHWERASFNHITQHWILTYYIYLIENITCGTRYTILVAIVLVDGTQIVGQVEMGIQLTTNTTTSLVVVRWIKG